METSTATTAAYYTIQNFPIFVAHHGNWDIYRNATGHCAAIAVETGCHSSGFGDWNYTRCTLSLEGINLPVAPESQTPEAGRGDNNDGGESSLPSSN